MQSLDTHPDELLATFGGPLLAAVATMTGIVAGLPLEAAVLSASHQIRTVDGHALETLSCDAEPTERTSQAQGGVVDGTTQSVRTATGLWSLRVAYAVRTVDPDRLAALIADLPARALVHHFPGANDAITAIVLDHGGWRTWHAYPEHGLLASSATMASHIPASHIPASHTPATVLAGVQ